MEHVTMHSPHCFIMNGGALGDTISAIPAMKYAAEKIFTDGRFTVMLPPELRQLFPFLKEENVMYFGVENKVTSDHIIIRQYDNIPTTLHPSAIPSPMRMSLIDYASMKFLGLLMNIEDKNYPAPNLDAIEIKKFKLPEKYACILVTNLNPNRSIPFEDSYRIANHFLRHGITPVFMGKNTKIHDTFNRMDRQATSPKGRRWMIDLVDKTSIMEAAKVMAGAVCVVGADTGLIHLAACTDVKIICGFTTVSPELRIPFRHDEMGWNFTSIVPPESSCRFCSSSWQRYDLNFNECYRKDLQCVSNALSSENFIAAIDAVLEQ